MHAVFPRNDLRVLKGCTEPEPRGDGRKGMTTGRKEYTNNPRSRCTRHLYSHGYVWENKIPCSPGNRESHESSFYYRRYREDIPILVFLSLVVRGTRYKGRDNF